MPSFYSYTEGLSISIGPVGFRRFKLFSCFFPYLYGSEIKFDIHIKNEIEKPIPYEWRLSYYNGKERNYVGDEINKGEFYPGRKHIIINARDVFDLGQYSLQMRWGENIANNKNYKQMVIFTLMDRDIYIVNWMHALSSGIVGAIIGAIITWLAIVVIN